MKKWLLFVVILVSISFANAQSDSLSVVLPDVVIKENRLEMPFSEVSRSIQVMTARQIEALPVQSINEVIQYISGVDVRQRGANGVQADVSIRGGTFDQTLVMINGVKMTDPQTGHHIMNIPIDLENVERIEVLKGPGARIYGMNAFSGAINIVTKAPDEQFVKIKLQAGENGMGGAQISASFPKENMNQYFSFSKDFAEGYRYNTDYDMTNLFYQNQIEIGQNQLDIMAGFTERQFGANGFYASPDARDQYEEVQTSVVSLDYKMNLSNWTLNPRLFWRRNQDEYVFVRSNPSIYRNLHIGNVYGAEFHASNRNALGTTGIGLELNQVDLASSNLGDQQRFTTSLFVEHRFQLLDGALDIIPGLSLNHFSDFGTKVFPGIDAGLRLDDHFKLYGNWGYTYRVPTFTDLYYEDPANLGNPDLQPEEAMSYELGVKYNGRGTNLQASYFNRQGNDLIDWIKEADSLQWQPVNVNQLTAQGVDVSLDFFFPVIFNKNSWLRRLNIGYTYIDAAVEENDAPISRYALENLNHQFIAGLEYRIGGRFYHSVQFRYIDRVTMEDYTVIDTRLNYRRDNYEIFLKATNVGDTEYRETNLVPMPGRWIRGGVEVKF